MSAYIYYLYLKGKAPDQESAWQDAIVEERMQGKGRSDIAATGNRPRAGLFQMRRAATNSALKAAMKCKRGEFEA